MSDLFDQLKSSDSVKKINLPSSKDDLESCVYNAITVNTKNNEYNENNNSYSSGTSRESLPLPPSTNITKKSKNHKARSLSPPKYDVNNMKSLKVMLERKKIADFITHSLEEHDCNIQVNQEKYIDIKEPKKMTPTKAQQKLFEPTRQKKTKAQLLKDYNIRPCKVRIRRDNLQELLKDFKDKSYSKKDTKSKGNKRLASTSLSSSPPSKKGKQSTVVKSKNSFFIKLNTFQSGKLEKKVKSNSRSSSVVAHHNKIKNSKTTTTAPTKFSRSNLIRSFGKRFFNVQVKIERCTHPLMLTFESNDRARRLQARRNKSKNLSVSFRDQVEIFGVSSDSDDSYDEDFCAISNRNNRKSSSSYSTTVSPKSIVMPARLKKVENGKVIDDIEFDPSLFLDPKNMVSSTPFSPSHKKRDHRSFSPLKDESSPSPRKEQLKLANERIPPSGLRRLNMEEDDDEDDDCEYIVPIEMPQRRTSRTSSNTTLEDVVSTTVPPAEETDDFSKNLFDDAKNVNSTSVSENLDKNTDLIINYNNIDIEKNKLESPINIENGSDDSFQSAKDDVEKDNEPVELKIYDNDNNDNQLPTLQCSQHSPVYCENSNNLQMNGECEVGTNENEKNFKSLALNARDDVSKNLFVEDAITDEDDDNHAKKFVDSLINETIDKLNKDIDESSTDKQFAI